MDLWNFTIDWQNVSAHEEESYEAVVDLPPKLEAGAVINIGRGPEFGGHTITVYDSHEYNIPPLIEIHSQEDLPLEDQAIAAIAALVKWVKEAMYLYELNELDPSGEFYVR